jgi:hypothetical protein
MTTSKALFILAPLAGLISANALATSCDNQIFGINAGRGEVGIVFNIDEYTPSASVHSKALFSSAAIAFVPETNRLYYVSAQRPRKYQLDISGLDLNETELKSLPILGRKHVRTELAYVDLATKEHHLVGKTEKMYQLAYNEADQKLYGAQGERLYTVNPETAETVFLGKLSGGKELSRGDLAFHNGKLFMLTNSRTYLVDINSLTLTELSKHEIYTLTGAVFNKDGNLIVSKERIDDYGSRNTTELFNVNPYSGKSCKIGEIPAQISDLAVNTLEVGNCNVLPMCHPETATISIEAVESEVVEGNALRFDLVLSDSFSQDVSVAVSTQEGSATHSDYRFADQEVTFPAGETRVRIEIPTTDNDVYSDAKQFTLAVAGLDAVSGSDSVLATIENDDAECTPVAHNRIHYRFVSESAGYDNDWGLLVNGRYVKLLDERGRAGFFDVRKTDSIAYVLSLNGNPNRLSSNYRQRGNTQYWEDQTDNDYNDFVVSVQTEVVYKGCH